MAVRGRVALRVGAIALLAAAVVAAIVAIRPPGGRQVPAGFSLHVVASGLHAPTAVRFADDGRMFVAEKSGRIIVFAKPGDGKPTLFADLSRNVYDTWDHGLLALALDPDFPREPYVYVAYTHNAAIGGTAPRWPSRNGTDTCPDPPGILKEGCVSSGRLSVLTARGDHMAGKERVLIEDWCQQSNTHSVGDLQFGEDGALYMSAGDGAFYAFTDYGQRGDPPNPCGDPPGGVGARLRLPTSEGGALRAQDLRSSGDPVTLDGTVIRVDRRTGRALPGNPLTGSRDPNARRIVAYGLKQPFRLAIRPGTNEVWVGDVGDSRWEEIDRITPDRPVEDFGWPCYEGREVHRDSQGSLEFAKLDMCKRLGRAAVTEPVFAYRHGQAIVSSDRCPRMASSISGLLFVLRGRYPGDYGNALFFADASRGCIWALPIRGDGLPDPTRPRIVVRRAGAPVDLQLHDGRIYYVDVAGGRIVRVDYSGPR